MTLATGYGVGCGGTLRSFSFRLPPRGSSFDVLPTSKHTMWPKSREVGSSSSEHASGFNVPLRSSPTLAPFDEPARRGRLSWDLVDEAALAAFPSWGSSSIFPYLLKGNRLVGLACRGVADILYDRPGRCRYGQRCRYRHTISVCNPPSFQ